MKHVLADSIESSAAVGGRTQTSRDEQRVRTVGVVEINELRAVVVYEVVAVNLKPDLPYNRTRIRGKLAGPPRRVLSVINAGLFLGFLSAPCQSFPGRVSDYVSLSIGIGPCELGIVVAEIHVHINPRQPIRIIEK